MSSRPLLVFDFDGVLVDGMEEYWASARGAALRLAPSLLLPEAVPAGFTALRPLIHKGWEMVLMAAELSRPELSLPELLAGYDAALEPALARWGWSAGQLQQSLEEVRREAIRSDREAWLARHRFYPGVPERLRALAAEGIDWLVLTTKGGAFAAELLAAAELSPRAVYGHEQGSKPEVLLQLCREEGRIGFLEDRRPTLEQVRRTPGLEAVVCLLVAWGYLAPEDGQDLPAGIELITAERFAAPLANWPGFATVRPY
ncbi:MAG: HAD family hydrolase [Synechococcus sp.]|nr:HAD family hydrolase [Synechococcus sp.]